MIVRKARTHFTYAKCEYKEEYLTQYHGCVVVCTQARISYNVLKTIYPDVTGYDLHLILTAANSLTNSQ